jgi:hypothetical protein
MFKIVKNSNNFLLSTMTFISSASDSKEGSYCATLPVPNHGVWKHLFCILTQHTLAVTFIFNTTDDH